MYSISLSILFCLKLVNKSVILYYIYYSINKRFTNKSLNLNNVGSVNYYYLYSLNIYSVWNY